MTTQISTHTAQSATDRAYAAIVETTDAAIITLDELDRITEWNPAAQRLYGFSAHEATGQPIDIIIPPSLVQQEHDLLHRVRNGLSVERIESERRTKSDARVFVSVTLYPLMLPEGKVGVRTIAQDVTAQMHAEERFRQLFNSCPTGLCVVDRRGCIQVTNPAFCRVFGYSQEELNRQPVEMLIPAESRATHPSLRAAYSAAPSPRPMGAGRDLQAVRKDGTRIAVEIGLCPLTASDGAVLCSVLDITERLSANAALRDVADRLRVSNAELEKFAYVVSHDLKAPLRGIASVADWIRSDLGHLASADTKENLDLMIDRVHRLSKLIDGILAYSRAGRGHETRNWVDTAQSVREVVSAVAPPSWIGVSIVEPLPPVFFNETQLRQVFQNLIDNAIRHLGKPDGKVIVSGRVEGDMNVFSVKDTGVGIPERHFDRIFELFQTLKPKDETKTTGAGLAIVKRIIESAGGTITVASTLGEGSEFTFTIPVKPGGLGTMPGTEARE